MLQENVYNEALRILEQYCPKNGNYEPIINSEVQKNEIADLKKTIKYEQFFFVIDLTEQKINHTHGLRDWLGYEDSTFSLFDYFKVMHPRFYKSIFMLAASSFETANSKQFEVKFMQNRVVAQIALRHKNGEYLFCKRSLYPFQIDKSGKVISYLNHFVVLKEYEELDALEPRVAQNERLTILNQEEYLQNVKEKLMGANNPYKLNEKEISILRLIADNPSINQKDICKKLNISLTTLRKTDNRRILDKARDVFDTEIFKNIKEVALFLRKEKIL